MGRTSLRSAAGNGGRTRTPGRHQVTHLPRLFPLYAHRAIVIDVLPGFPSTDGNPVFSVHQTDVVSYGNDLADWFSVEFGIPRPHWAAPQPRRVPFWSDLSDPGRWSADPAWMPDQP